MILGDFILLFRNQYSHMTAADVSASSSSTTVCLPDDNTCSSNSDSIDGINVQFDNLDNNGNNDNPLNWPKRWVSD